MKIFNQQSKKYFSLFRDVIDIRKIEKNKKYCKIFFANGCRSLVKRWIGVTIKNE